MLQESVRKKRAGEGGFTLIELLIVIVILGILAAIVVFAVGGITDRGNTSACKSDVKTVEVAEEAYFAQNGSYTDMPDPGHRQAAQAGSEHRNGYTISVNRGPAT